AETAGEAGRRGDRPVDAAGPPVGRHAASRTAGGGEGVEVADRHGGRRDEAPASRREGRDEAGHARLAERVAAERLPERALHGSGGRLPRPPPGGRRGRIEPGEGAAEANDV